MKILDWNVDSDKENIREGAIELRAKVAENMYYDAYGTPAKAKKQVSTGRTAWRHDCLSKVEILLNRPISGKIIEIGAGTGWCSAMLSKKEEVESIDVLDYDAYSVQTLVPLVFKNLGGNVEKATGVIGSYNALKCEDNTYDFVISIGAIHHSENLAATFQEAYRALKPGGVLVAIEHCHANSYSILEQQAEDDEKIGEERAKRLYGDASMNVSAKANSDHNYRLCEFETHAYGAGFNILPYVFDENGEPADDSIFAKPKLYNGFAVRTFFPYYVRHEIDPMFDNFMIVAEKPDGDKESAFFKESNLVDFHKPSTPPSSLEKLFKKVYYKFIK